MRRAIPSDARRDPLLKIWFTADPSQRWCLSTCAPTVIACLSAHHHRLSRPEDCNDLRNIVGLDLFGV